MSLRIRVGLIILWAASVVAVGAWAHAQAPALPAPASQPPTVIAGNDVGFRVESRKGKTPVGTLVVRMDGQWVEVEFGVGMKRLTAR